MRYMVVIEVRLSAPMGQRDGGATTTMGGYFRSIGVDANTPEEAVEAARHAAVEPDEQSDWQPLPDWEIGEVEIAAAEGHDTSLVGADGIIFRSGRVFYSAKRWWQFWK